MAKTTPQYKERLAEIAETVFGQLSDDQILQLLAERKQLENLREQYELAQKEQEKKSEREAEKKRVQKELDRLNALISPDKQDDELIHLIEERKTWEAQLAALETGTPLTEENPAAVSEKEVTVEEENNQVVAQEEVPLEADVLPKPMAEGETPQEEEIQANIDKDFGTHKIEETVEPNSELGRYLERMQNDPETMGRILEDLPGSAKQNKVFMLAVAEIDPAYAMHYADKDVLKKDEDFNLKVVETRGRRTSGSVLAEMLPEARTEAVVMAALKQDYRNVRFVLPQMAGYDAMLEKAKKAALEKVKEMKESVDISLLVPKILQKDKSFMEKITGLVSKSE